MDTDLERIKKLEECMKRTINSLASSFSSLAERIEKLEHNMIFLLDLGIEKHIADHNRELHEREMSLDFKNDAGLSRAGIDY